MLALKSQLSVLRSIAICFLVIFVFLFDLRVSANSDGVRQSAHDLYGRPSFSIAEYSDEILSGIEKVSEFKVIQDEAKKRGLQVWLFGGTAAAFAHYVRWDLMRKHGDSRFQADRFDYDYTNIFRTNQDLDLAVDGNEEEAQAFQSWLSIQFEYFLGEKNKWEVRSLHSPRGNKYALLGDANFLNQHSDSHSTGLIEITKKNDRTENQGQRIRDIRDWDSAESQFLKDAYLGDLHYYFGPKHDDTTRARQGLNPPIFSVVRYLIKAFQYELRLDERSETLIKQFIDSFSPEKDLWNSEARSWIEKNGKKLIQNSVNIEYAWNTLERLGLRKKLIQIENNLDEENSLAWWLSREPLRTKPLGIGDGRRASDLGITILAHETLNYWTYESMTRAHTGEANVLISRAGISGEAAVHGNGFYTAMGEKGARGTQYTIHFKLHPKAREGSDFIIVGNEVKEGAYIIILNRAAIEVIPESFNFGLLEFFKALESGLKFDGENNAILEKLKRRFLLKFSAGIISKEELSKTYKVFEYYFSHPKYRGSNYSFMEEFWYSFPLSTGYLDHLGNGTLDFSQWLPEHKKAFFKMLKKFDHWGETRVAVQFLDRLGAKELLAFDNGDLVDILATALSSLKSFENVDDRRIFWRILNKLELSIDSYYHSILMTKLIGKKRFLECFFSNTQSEQSQLLIPWIKKRKRDSDVGRKIGNQMAQWAISKIESNHQLFLSAVQFLKSENDLERILEYVIQYPKLLDTLLLNKDPFSRKVLSMLLVLFEEKHEKQILRAIAERYQVLKGEHSKLADYLDKKIEALSRNPYFHTYLWTKIFPLLSVTQDQKYRVLNSIFSFQSDYVHTILGYPWSLENRDDMQFLSSKKKEIDLLPDDWWDHWVYLKSRVYAYTGDGDGKTKKLDFQNIPEVVLKEAYLKFEAISRSSYHLNSVLNQLAHFNIDRYLSVFGASDIAMKLKIESDESGRIQYLSSSLQNSPLLMRIEDITAHLSKNEILSEGDERIVDFVFENSFDTEISKNILVNWLTHSPYIKEKLLKRLKTNRGDSVDFVFNIFRSVEAEEGEFSQRIKNWLYQEMNQDQDWRKLIRNLAIDAPTRGTNRILAFPWDIQNEDDRNFLILLQKEYDHLSERSKEIQALINEIHAKHKINMTYRYDGIFHPSYDEPREVSNELNKILRLHQSARLHWPDISKRLKEQNPDLYEKFFGRTCPSLLEVLGLEGLQEGDFPKMK